MNKIEKSIVSKLMPALMLANYLLKLQKDVKFKTLFHLYDDETERFKEFLRDIMNDNVPYFRKSGDIYFYYPHNETFHNCVGKFRVIYNETEKSFSLRDLYTFYVWCHEENHDIENCNCNLDHKKIEEFSYSQGLPIAFWGINLEIPLPRRLWFKFKKIANSLFFFKINTSKNYINIEFSVFLLDELFIGKGKPFLTLGKIYYNQELDEFFWEDGDVL